MGDLIQNIIILILGISILAIASSLADIRRRLDRLERRKTRPPGGSGFSGGES